MLWKNVSLGDVLEMFDGIQHTRKKFPNPAAMPKAMKDAAHGWDFSKGLSSLSASVDCRYMMDHMGKTMPLITAPTQPSMIRIQSLEFK